MYQRIITILFTSTVKESLAMLEAFSSHIFQVLGGGYISHCRRGASNDYHLDKFFQLVDAGLEKKNSKNVLNIWMFP